MHSQVTEPASGGCPTQYFWEAFPASASPTQRTTYMFTYMDLDPKRPSVLQIMDDYWRMLPRYQGVDLEALRMRRVLFGLFTSYKDSPLPVRFDRVMQARGGHMHAFHSTHLSCSQLPVRFDRVMQARGGHMHAFTALICPAHRSATRGGCRAPSPSAGSGRSRGTSAASAPPCRARSKPTPSESISSPW